MADRRQRACLVCGKSMTHRVATDEQPYHFDGSGLESVFLIGIDYYECPNGHRSADIPALEQLLTLIARDVVEKNEALNGSEVRFLRKRLGKKALEFAKEVGLDPATLSRIENNKQDASESTDKLIRLHYALSSGDPVLLEEIRKALAEILTGWKQEKTETKVVAKITNHAWETELIAA